jgi:hypothetical protein
MNEFGVIVGVIAIVAVIGADIIVRLVIAPYRRDKWLESLLDSMIEQGSAGRAAPVFPVAASLDEALRESLLRHFEQSATSRHVLAALAFRTDGTYESEVLAVVNRQLARLRKRELPASVVRKVVMILMGADLAVLRQGRLELTTAGKRLHALLEVRSASPLPAPAFASPSA